MFVIAFHSPWLGVKLVPAFLGHVDRVHRGAVESGVVRELHLELQVTAADPDERRTGLIAAALRHGEHGLLRRRDEADAAEVGFAAPAPVVRRVDAAALRVAAVVGARVVVIAGARVVREDAADRRIAAVGRAGIRVVARDGGCADTGAARARVVSGARVAVVARFRVVRGDAPDRRVAGIRRAEVAVVAALQGPGPAGARSALVVRRAGVPVVAR
jgi:hypothetical protein